MPTIAFMVTNNPAATLANSHTKSVEGLARQLLDTCLIESGSVLTPGVAVWTAHNLAELHGCFVDVDAPSGRTVGDKISAALAEVSDSARQLFAELYVLYLLPLSSRTFKQSTKRRFITEVLEPIHPPIAVPPEIDEAFADGIFDVARPSAGQRWAQLAFLVQFAEHLKRQDPATRERAGSDPLTLRRLVLETPADSTPTQRHTLQYLLHPDYFLPIASAEKRLRLRNALASRYLPEGTSDDVDADLRRIDDAVHASTDEAVDYYTAPWRRLWLDEDGDVPEVLVAEANIPVVAAPVEVHRKLHPMARGTYRVSSGYKTPDRPTHRGVDFAANIGVPIYAPADGFFAHVGINDDPGGFGSWLVLDAQREWGLDFVFGHMRPSSIVNPDTGAAWRKGDRVRAGQQIATVGNEGGSTGPHLHFETWGTPGRFGGQDRNPNTAWLNDAEDPRTPVSSDPDVWPLPQGVYWGPLEGPAESWSNLAGSEPQYSKDGLRRWQVALGLPGSGVYDEATRAAAIRLQAHFGWAVSGNIFEGEWNEVIRKGWRLPVGEATPLVANRPGPQTKDGRALAIIEEGNRRHITERGIKIALSTALVESNLVMYANNGDPESLNFPHDKLSRDANSVGLFQQRAPWWGTVADRMDPARSAGLFYAQLAKRDYNSAAHTPGWFAAEIQQCAVQFRGRYDERFGEASALYTRLAPLAGGHLTPSDPDGWPLPPGVYWGPLEGPAESWSNLAGSEPQYSKDGLRRWQVALGLPGSGVYDEATRAAAIRMQTHFGWAVSGNVAEGEWNEVIRKGWQLPAHDARPAAPVTSAGGYPVAWYSGPGYTPGHAAYLRIYLHTTENQDWITRAEDVADYQTRTKNGPDAGSYHFLVDDKHIINTVATKNTAWGLHKDNRFSVQIAMVGTSGEIEQWPGANPNIESRPKRREQWLAHPKMLDMVAYLIAIVARDFQIPIERVDVEGVGGNRRGVSSHNNYTYGSAKLHGSKDGDHWDVPNTFPYDVVLAAAKGYEAIVSDPDRLPLPPGHYWGPLDGPSESWSNMFGNEPQSSKDGLTRWQTAVGIQPTGVYDDATKDAATRLQRAFSWPDTGHVAEGEWNEVIRRGWHITSSGQAVDPQPAPVIDVIEPGPIEVAAWKPWQLDEPLMRGPEVVTIKDKLYGKFQWVRDKYPSLVDRTDVYDEATAAAIKEFQFRVGFESTGIADYATKVRLGVVVATATTMSMVATVPGTWAGWNDGPPAFVAWGLDAHRFRQQGVGYPAMGFLRPDPNVSYNESRAAGTAELLRLSLPDSGPKVWIGYSQGADVIVRALDAWPAERRAEIRAVVTFGSPGRRPGPTLLGNNPRGAGISGVYTPDWALDRTWDFCLDGDMYCNAVGLLPQLYDILTRMEVSQEFAMYLFQVLTSLVGGQLLGTQHAGEVPGAGTLSGIRGMVTAGPVWQNGGPVDLGSIVFNLPAIIQTLAAAVEFVMTNAHSRYHDLPAFNGMTAVDRARQILNGLAI